MKTNFKILAVSFLLIFPTLVYGVASVNSGTPNNSNRGKNETAVNAQAKFCERISDLSSRVGQRFSERREKIETKAQERLAKWEEKTSERDVKLAELRSQRDAHMEENLSLLNGRAESEEQKAAVSKFEEMVRNALETRRKAMDEAIENFRAEVKKIHASRKATVNSETEAFLEAQEKAFSQAKSDCEAGKDPATVRTDLRSALKSGQTTFSVKENGEKVRTQMQALIQTRKNAMEKAKTDFQAEMEKARAEIKKVFPVAESTE